MILSESEGLITVKLILMISRFQEIMQVSNSKMEKSFLRITKVNLGHFSYSKMICLLPKKWIIWAFRSEDIYLNLILLLNQI